MTFELKVKSECQTIDRREGKGREGRQYFPERQGIGLYQKSSKSSSHQAFFDFSPFGMAWPFLAILGAAVCSSVTTPDPLGNGFVDFG